MINKKFIIYLFLAVLLLAYSFISTHKQLKHNNDFPVYYDTARAVINSENIYLVHSQMYIYPPILAIILVPFSLLPLEISTWLWYWVNIGALFGVFYFGFRILSVEPKKIAKREWILFLTLLFSLRFILHNLDLGQINLVILFLTMWSFFLFETGKPFWAGIVLSLGISIKLTPILLFLYFLYKRRFLLCLGSIIGMIFFLLIFPSIFLGIETNLKYLSTFYQKMIAPYSQAQIGWLATTNQSFLAGLGRFLTDSSVGIKVNFLSLSQDVFRWVIYIFVLIYILFLALVCRGSLSGSNKLNRLVQYGLILVSMLLLSSISQKHHFVLLVFPYLISFYILFNVKLERSWLKNWLIISFMLCSLTSDGLMGRQLSEILLSFSAITFGSWALFFGLLPYARKRLNYE